MITIAMNRVAVTNSDATKASRTEPRMYIRLLRSIRFAALRSPFGTEIRTPKFEASNQ